MLYTVYNCVKKIHPEFWPAFCLLCQARVPAGRDLCGPCEQSLPRVTSCCSSCAAPGVAIGIGEAICGECQKSPPAFAGTRAAFHYAPPLDRLIQHLKYHGRLDLSRVLGGYLADHLLTLDEPRPDVVIPVPLHVSRLRERGYNQSLELARIVARRLSLSLDWKHALRRRATAPQADLSRDQRRKNVRGAFASSEFFSGKRVALVDDVMTSGHTVNELAQSLRRSGAQDVRVWVVARA